MAYPRIILADDHAEIRKKIADMLMDNFDVVASVANGREAVLATLKFKPDLLITDISMPILDGIQVASQLRDLGYNTRIIFLTVHRDCDYVQAAFSVGAFGYVLKPKVSNDLITAIQAALEGRQFSSDLSLHQFT